MQTLSCGVWDLVPWSEMEPGPPALGAWSLNYWTTREVPHALFLLFFKSFIYLLLIFGCAGSPWLCAGFFSPLVVVSWGYSSLWCLSFRCGGFSRCRAQALGRGFRGCGTQTLECGLSSRGEGLLPWGTWNLPGPRIKPCCSGRQILITVPPGKSPSFISWISILTFFFAADSFFFTSSCSFFPWFSCFCSHLFLPVEFIKKLYFLLLGFSFIS